MALSPIRKWLNITFGLILLAFIGALLWPLVSRPFVLKAFCDELQPGVAFSDAQGRASQHGFKVTPPHDNTAQVYDLQSLGKFHCTLSLRGNTISGLSFTFRN